MSATASLKSLLKIPFNTVFDLLQTENGFLMFKEEMLVHQQQDQWGYLLVLDHKGQRVLSFDSIYEQSRMDLQRPSMLVHQYTRAMLLGLTFTNPERITLFGLGGGCLVRAAHLIDHRFKIHAVELREAVVNIAQEYFGLPISDNVSISVADGRDYIGQQADHSTDIIFADMYHAIKADPFQTQKKFFQESHRILSPDGWLIINCHEYPAAGNTFFSFLKQYFQEILVCVVPGGNYVFYAGKSPMSKLKELIPAEIEYFEFKTKTKLGFLLEHIEPVT